MFSKIIYAITIYAALLLLINVVHFTFFPVNVVLYSALLDAVIAAIFSAIVVWFFIFKRQIVAELFGLLVTVFLLCGYIYAISIPTVIDRSYSMYLLEKIHQHQGRLHIDAFDTAITSAFMTEHRLNDVRLTEQLESGTITIENDCVILTPRGHRIAAFTHWYRTTLLPKKRLLMGQYSDDLTNPFRQPSTLSEYQCH